MLYFKILSCNDLDDLDDFYYNVFSKSFTDKNECESYDSILNYLIANCVNDSEDWKYHYWVVVAKDSVTHKVIGGAIFDYFRHSNSAVIEYLVISEDYRKSGIGRMLYNYAYSVINSSALSVGFEKVDYVFCEVEKSAWNSISYWKAMNFNRVCLNYIQPPLSLSKTSVDNLYLLVNTSEDIMSIRVRGFLADFFMYAFSIKDIGKCDEYRRISLDLSRSKFVSVAK